MKKKPSKDTMASGPVDILPIPPALEFPYPEADAISPHSSASDVVENAGKKAGLRGNKGMNSSERRRSAEITGAAQETEQLDRPLPPNRSVTEKPTLHRQIPSYVGIKRAATGEPLNALAQAISASYSDTDSSSSDENPDPIAHQRAIHASKAKNLAGRKPSAAADDPYRRFKVGNEGYRTKGHVSKRDGRLKISLKETEGKGYLAKTLGATLLRHHLGAPSKKPEDDDTAVSPLREDGPPVRPGMPNLGTSLSMAPSAYDERPLPRLKIVIMVIGSRGDIQPFLRLGKILKEEHGHRVRIATHPAFKDFVEKDAKLEFFSVGGDPSELMAFMVKNPGLIPKPETIRQGEIARRRDAMYEMFQGFWRACINATDDEHDAANLKMMFRKSSFIADVIIANPPSFAHIHCAERLGVPLHIMFTFPTSPTQQFPHPLANIKQTNIDANYTNFMSYPLVEMMQWQGLGDLINKFRMQTLGLDPVSTLWAPGQLFRLRVPYSYLWSPGLIPKPADWGPEIDITGFVFLDLASSFKPAKELEEFLNAGDPPVYIGFGSIVVDDPDRFTSLIFEAVSKAGVRALVSKGWGGLGDENNTPDNVYMLGNTPHDWLFPRVSAVVHHGGAGTTAIGMKCGKPTMIVPFFGDQPFWGSMVHKAGAGAKPVPYKKLTADILAESIKELLKPETQAGAMKLAQRIEDEGDGATNAVKSFHRSLPLRGNHSMRCSILEDRVAVWWLKGRRVRLSALAAEILVEKKKIRWSNLKLIRHYSWADFEGPGEPITGAGSALSRNIGRIVMGLGGTPFKWATSIKEERRRSESRKSMEGKNDSEIAKTNGNANKQHKSSGENTSKTTQNRTGKNEHADLPIGNEMGKPLTKEMSDRATPKAGGGKSAPMVDTPDEREEEDLAMELATETGAGLAEAGKALASLPMDLSLALAQGFHNAPRLWGDDTVRAPTKVTGIKSGLIAARREFAYGIYDGWTGVVKHPIDGAKKDGVLGFTKGVGKGLGGFVLKDIAALAGLPAYAMKGVAKEMGKGKQPKAFIRRAQIVQGQYDVTELPKEELNEVVDVVSKAWKTLDIIGAEKEAIEKNSGLRGRLELEREKRRWKEHAVFENVESTNRALQAHKLGKDFDEEFYQHKREVDKQLGPRRSAMQSSLAAKNKANGMQNGAADAAAAAAGGDANIAGEQTGTEAKDQLHVANGVATKKKKQSLGGVQASDKIPARPKKLQHTQTL